MKIVHRITITSNGEVMSALTDMGFRRRLIENKFIGILTLEIAEQEPSWHKIWAIVRDLNPLDVCWTTFSHAELACSKTVGLAGVYQSQYPQPEKRYRQETYDLSGFCKECGIGLAQRASFRLKKEPTWKRTTLFQPFWIHDELFVNFELWAQVIETFRLRTRPVLKTDGKRFENIVQLYTEDFVDLELPKRLKWISCDECGRRRYWMMQRGPLPYPKIAPLGHYFKSNQWFGSGHMAFRQMCFSHELYMAIYERGLKGATFSVCAAYPDSLGDPSPGGA